MDKIIPTSNICKIREVPPELKNGSDIPVFGIVLVTTAIFITTCKAIFSVKPHTVSAQNLSGAL